MLKKLISKKIMDALPSTYYGSGDSLHLTFDDGPSLEYTPTLLELLAKDQQKATFFLIGEQANKYPDLVCEIHEQGHSIGCHSQSHVNASECSFGVLYKDYKLGKTVLEDILDQRITLFRPPYGTCNLKVVVSAKLLSMNVILWDCDPKDWIEGRNRTQITNAIKPFLKFGSIILLHDWVFDNPNARDRTETIMSTEAVLMDLKHLGIRSTGL